MLISTEEHFRSVGEGKEQQQRLGGWSAYFACSESSQSPVGLEGSGTNFRIMWHHIHLLNIHSQYKKLTFDPYSSQ